MPFPCSSQWDGVCAAPNLWGNPALLLRLALSWLFCTKPPSLLCKGQEGSFKIRIKVTCELPGSCPCSLPVAPPPSRDVEGTRVWKSGGEVSGGGFELGRLQLRSSWMLQKKTKRRARFPRVV